MKLKSGNKLHSDGRIYQYGDGISITLSPYSPDFYENIEDEIEPLVRLLVNKGYLTYSSCAGHQAVKRRFVSVAFPSIERAEQFIKDIQKIYESNLISFTLKRTTDYYDSTLIDRNDHNSYLNGIFYRGYNDYYFIELSIGKNTAPTLGNALQIIRKLLFRDFVTFRLVKAIARIPDYDM